MISLTLPYPPTTNKRSHNAVAVDRVALTVAYRETGSVHKAAARVGISHSVAHRRLTAWGEMKHSRFSDDERQIIRAYYEQTPAEDFHLATIAARLGRERTVVCGEAQKLGLTQKSRTKSVNAVASFKKARAGFWSRHPHPRGFQGNTHSPEARAIISQKSEQAWAHMKATGTGNMSPESLQALSDRTSARMAAQPAENAYSRCQGGRRPDIGEMYFRSAWEANYARYLNWLKARGDIDGWEYEPVTFWFEKIKRGVRSYKPDFRVTEKGKSYFVEVKGWMDDKSKTKLKRMNIYHPTVEVRVFGEKEYRDLKSKLGRIIPGWEGAGGARVYLTVTPV